jgi:hypothetical protein
LSGSRNIVNLLIQQGKETHHQERVRDEEDIMEMKKESRFKITKRVKREASLRKWSISDDVLEIIARDVLEGR